MTIELTHSQLQELKDNIEIALEDWSIEHYKDEPRTHLGISEIGEECKRKLYYKFRWFAFEEFSGRMRRLFARGHREEERYINYLEGIGCKVHRFQQELWYSEPLNDYKVLEINADKSGGVGSYEQVKSSFHLERAKKLFGIELKQFRMSGVLGHYGGRCDGVATTPWYPDLPMLLEFKTHNTKSFVHYVDKGLQISKPKHFDQMSGYGEKLQIQYGLYFPENKNDDDIQVTPIKLDWNRGRELEKKAAEIILANEPPPRISENPAFWNCKTCFAKDICHNGAVPVKNCRSCKNSMPTDNATWTCAKFGIVPPDFIIKGCDQWMPL